MLRKLWSSRWTPVCVAGAVALAALIAYKALDRRIQRAETTYRLPTDLLVRGNPNLMEVALTFDDGPKRAFAEPILDTLKAEGVQATFFIVGEFAVSSPDLIRRMMAEGHEVGNHTMTHPRLTTLNERQVRAELQKCEEAVRAATGGVGMSLFRPPGMQYTEPILRTIQDMDYVTVHWNVVAGDYVEVPPGVIADRVLEQVVPGSVILLHTSPDTAQALPQIIRRLRAQGYRFVTVSEMLARLPRPVFCKSNAYAVKLEEEPPAIAGRGQRNSRRRQGGDERSRPLPEPIPTKPIDVPVGGGPATSAIPQVDQQGLSADSWSA